MITFYFNDSLCVMFAKSMVSSSWPHFVRKKKAQQIKKFGLYDFCQIYQRGQNTTTRLFFSTRTCATHSNWKFLNSLSVLNFYPSSPNPPFLPMVFVSSLQCVRLFRLFFFFFLQATDRLPGPKTTSVPPALQTASH